MKFLIDLSLLRRNKNFTLIFIGQFVSLIGTMVTSVALPFQIYSITKSTLMVGLLSLCQLLPLLVTALMGGVYADRKNRRTMILIAEALLCISCLLLCLNAYLWQNLAILFIVAPIMSAINGFHRPALESIVQQIVAKKDLPVVSAISTFKYSIGMIFGPALGGLIIAKWGVTFTYLVDASTFLVSFIAVLAVQNLQYEKVDHEESVLSSLKQGVRYALGRQDLLGTYMVDFIAMIFGMPNALFPAIADKFGGPSMLGLLYSAPAVGALAISFYGRWTHYPYHGRAIAIAASLWGVAIVFFGLATNFYVALFFLALAGMLDAISGIYRGVMWNQTIPNQYRGRLAGIEMISYLSGPRLGDTEAGLVAACFGITASIVSGGLMCVGGVLVCSYFLPKFWDYKATDDVTLLK